MKRKIEDIAVKAVISAAPGLLHASKSNQPDDLENSMFF
jgi:hypothetical protein